MKKLKIGLIGCGGIAKSSHAPAYENMDQVEIVGVCDIIEERAVAMGERLGTDRVYTDYRQIFEIPDLDAVDICTPNYLHSIIAVEALERGLHVFCEKPDAINASEAERMAEGPPKRITKS